MDTAVLGSLTFQVSSQKNLFTDSLKNRADLVADNNKEVHEIAFKKLEDFFHYNHRSNPGRARTYSKRTTLDPFLMKALIG
jgi:hypothetical protein